MNQNGKAQFFAFISHKSTDSKFALRLQRFIESYHLPAWVRRKTSAPKRLTPVCSYEVDFSSNPLLDEMKNKLAQSNYLILVCSKSLLRNGTKYVNYEIETFMECKRSQGLDPMQYVIPVIYDGAFDSPDEECCPEALRALGDERPIAVDRQKCRNEREVFLRVISAMLEIDYAVLQDRDAKRRRKKLCLWGAVAALALTAAVALGEYYIPRSYHYQDFVMRYGVPEGIEELTREEYTRLNSHYVIVVQKHRVVELRYVNSAGSLLDHPDSMDLGDRPARYTFDYSSSSLNSVTYYNRSGAPYFILQYSSGMRAADLKDPYDPDQAYFVGLGYESSPDNLLVDYNLLSHSDISRFEYEYDDRGFVTKVTFHADSTGRLAGDNDVYGFSYTLDEKGRIAETYFLDAQGERRSNSLGIFCVKFFYDDQNHRVRLYNSAADGSLVPNELGVIEMRRYYNENGNQTRLELYNAQGELEVVPVYGGAVQLQDYDKRGNRVTTFYLDGDEKPYKGSGTYGLLFTYNKKGFAESMSFLNESGSPTNSAALGYAKVSYTFDSFGNVLSEAFTDMSGNPVHNSEGYHKAIYEYGMGGKQTAVTYFDRNGDYADYCGYGYAIERKTYDERGRETSISYYSAEGVPATLKSSAMMYGYHKNVTTYNYGAFTVMETSFYDAEGKLVTYMDRTLGEGYARCELVIMNGSITSMVQYDEDGERCGVRMEVRVDHTPLAERLVIMDTFDVADRLVSRLTETYSVEGVLKSGMDEQYENGKLCNTMETTYFPSGVTEKMEMLTYSETGEIIGTYAEEYDKNGNVVYCHQIDLTDGAYAPQSEMTITYYGNGTVKQETYRLSTMDGTLIAEAITDYTTYGSKSARHTVYYDVGVKNMETWETYYENGEVATSANATYYGDGSLHTEEQCTMDENGNKLTKWNVVYFESGMRSVSDYDYHSDGTYTCHNAMYSADGTLLSEIDMLFDSEGNVIED